MGSAPADASPRSAGAVPGPTRRIPRMDHSERTECTAAEPAGQRFNVSMNELDDASNSQGQDSCKGVPRSDLAVGKHDTFRRLDLATVFGFAIELAESATAIQAFKLAEEPSSNSNQIE